MAVGWARGPAGISSLLGVWHACASRKEKGAGVHQPCVLFSSDVRFLLLLFSMPTAGTISPAILLWEAVPAACQ